MTDRPPRYYPNRFRSEPVGSAPPIEVIRRFHRALPGYRPTPLYLLPSLARELGFGALYVKDEGERFGLGAFKALGASWAVHRLLEDGLKAEVLSTASAGNHGRAVAWAARQHGLRAVVFMARGTEPARIDAIRGEGAEVMLVPGTYDDAVQACATRSADQGWQVVADVGYPGYETIPLLVAEGYATMLDEIEDALRLRGLARPDLVLVQGGVGCLASAVADHFARTTPRPRIMVVEPTEADCLQASARTLDGVPAEAWGNQQTIMGGLNCRRPSTTAWPVIRAAADGFLTITDEIVRYVMIRLTEGRGGEPAVSSGPSGAAGVAGLWTMGMQPTLVDGLPRLALPANPVVLAINTERSFGPVP